MKISKSPNCSRRMLLVTMIVLVIWGANICKAQSGIPNLSGGVFSSREARWKAKTLNNGHAISADQELTFHVKFSEPIAVYEFVSSLSAKTGDNSFKRLFYGSKFNQEKYQALIAEFDKLNLDTLTNSPSTTGHQQKPRLNIVLDQEEPLRWVQSNGSQRFRFHMPCNI